MVLYPPGRMNLTLNGRPRCFSKIGAIRATVLESRTGMESHKSESSVMLPLTCLSQSAISCLNRFSMASRSFK